MDATNIANKSLVSYVQIVSVQPQKQVAQQSAETENVYQPKAVMTGTLRVMTDAPTLAPWKLATPAAVDPLQLLTPA